VSKREGPYGNEASKMSEACFSERDLMPASRFARESTQIGEPVLFLQGLKNTVDLNLEATIAVRTDGLLGDNIAASKAFLGIRASEGNLPLVIYSTYNHNPSRVCLIYDLFVELFHSKIIAKIIHSGRQHGPVTCAERHFLMKLGCRRVYDCGPFEREFQGLDKTEPMLGHAIRNVWVNRKTPSDKVALLRWSGFHTHYPDRNRPLKEWQKIEDLLLDLGKQIILFGWDDPLPCSRNVIDLRRKLSPYETLWYMAQCDFLVSTVTFAPLFCQHYIPCLVLSDHRDVPNLKKRWNVSTRYEVFDVSSDYLGPLCYRIKELMQEFQRIKNHEVDSNR